MKEERIIPANVWIALNFKGIDNQIEEISKNQDQFFENDFDRILKLSVIEANLFEIEETLKRQKDKLEIDFYTWAQERKEKVADILHKIKELCKEFELGTTIEWN